MQSLMSIISAMSWKITIPRKYRVAYDLDLIKCRMNVISFANIKWKSNLKLISVHSYVQTSEEVIENQYIL